MFRTTVSLGVLAGILATVLLGGYGLHAFTRQFGIAMGIVVGLAVVAGTIARRGERRRVLADAEAVHRLQLQRNHGELTTLNAKLERAAHEWRTTADTIDAALIVLEPAGAILRMNLAAAATLPDGLAWLGHKSGRLAEHEPWNAALALVGDALDRQVVATARVREPNGQRTWDLSCRALPIQQRSAVLILARDVTGVVELEESVRRSEAMAALGSVVAGVAHEVRNPLFGISALVDAWALQPHRDPTPFVDALRCEVTRLRTLMVELLEYGTPTTSTLQPHELRSTIDNAVRACTHEATVRRVRIDAICDDGVEVLMDPRRLERVFINLIQNAVQHTPDDSTVQVEMRVTADPSSVAIAIRDRGPGFASEDLARAFAPFFSRRPGGFGLGLAITARIVTEHKGTVAAANNAAGGAVLTVSLPTRGTRPIPTAGETEAPCSRAAC